MDAERSIVETYEPPRLTVLGTFHDLTKAKVSPGADSATKHTV
jgi:hypothetical protein